MVVPTFYAVVLSLKCTKSIVYVLKALYSNYLMEVNHFLLNPCEHRATIVAPAYLKSSKKDKKLDQGIFCFKYIIKNLNLVPKK
jgi:hypothetical protein